jgi:hypothetical protein
MDRMDRIVGPSSQGGRAPSVLLDALLIVPSYPAAHHGPGACRAWTLTPLFVFSPLVDLHIFVFSDVLEA